MFDRAAIERSQPSQNRGFRTPRRRDAMTAVNDPLATDLSTPVTDDEIFRAHGLLPG